ncbi:MAG: hypothetical protein L6R40_006844 [Gallowayella cf. fulva]|nr:MAG: hypothetical protein L6R40_006844 [Xanthomendoza cf. fulva]
MLETRRLYVSPLDSDLLPIVLSGPLHHLASNVSYHTLQAFPERRYGYLDLPIPEADCLQKKLHGSILKGVKMKVEKARPEKQRTGGSQEGRIEDTPLEKKRRSKSKTEDGVLVGVELPGERKVKRGWTEPSAKEDKKTVKRKRSEKKDTISKVSAHTDGPECLFKAKLPPNAAAHVALDPPGTTTSKKRRRGDSEHNVVVHEFDETIKQASFFREGKNPRDNKTASSYLEGKGWLDQDGNVIEEVKETRTTRPKTRETMSNHGASTTAQVTNTRGLAMRGAGRAAVGEHRQTAREGMDLNEARGPESGKEDVSGGRRQLDEMTEGFVEERTSSEASESSRTDNEVNTDQVRAISTSRLSPTPPMESIKEVHPLEALFKRPQTAASQTPRKPSLEVKTGFSFFERDEDQASNTTVAIPQTPFTQQDFQERRLRSAAPTPDTAAPGKTSFGGVWSGMDSMSDEEDMDEEAKADDGTSTPVATTASTTKEAQGEAEESKFTKWFYEHRGETNRAWKRRRREAAKEKRQKENKKS